MLLIISVALKFGCDIIFVSNNHDIGGVINVDYISSNVQMYCNHRSSGLTDNTMRASRSHQLRYRSSGEVFIILDMLGMKSILTACVYVVPVQTL